MQDNWNVMDILITVRSSGYRGKFDISRLTQELIFDDFLDWISVSAKTVDYRTRVQLKDEDRKRM